MSDITIPEPTTSHRLWAGAVEIHCFGTPQNWSLAGETSLEAGMRNPGIQSRMLSLANRYGIDRIYAPNPSEFNGVIAHTDEFTQKWVDDRILRGPSADGVLLTEPNTAFAVSSADCPTGVIFDPHTQAVAAAHAGLMSMWDIGKDPVTMQMVDAIEKHASYKNALLRHRTHHFKSMGFLACGIRTKAYCFDVQHPRFTKKNAEILNWLRVHWPQVVPAEGSRVWVDLAGLYFLQLASHGVPMTSLGFDGACTYSDIDKAGKPLWHSNWREDATRNLVLVIKR